MSEDKFKNNLEQLINQKIESNKVQETISDNLKRIQEFEESLDALQVVLDGIIIPKVELANNIFESKTHYQIQLDYSQVENYRNIIQGLRDNHVFHHIICIICR